MDKNYFLCCLLAIPLMACSSQEKDTNTTQDTFQKYTPEQEAIIEEFSTNCAKRHLYTFEMNEWQACLDEGLAKDSTISYLWQQKAMPYFKARKYEVGMEYLDQAVKYNKRKYLPYRAFIKCIFSKNYTEAIDDFEAAIAMEGNSYEMDHTYQFYIALSYLQLNQFEKAEQIFAEDILEQEEKFEDGAHFLDRFYYGISKYEQAKWEEAIEQFDIALQVYPNFAEVLLYKGLALAKNGNMEEAEPLIHAARTEGENGNTFNEDNAIYEMYPYQFHWKR